MSVDGFRFEQARARPRLSCAITSRAAATSFIFGPQPLVPSTSPHVAKCRRSTYHYISYTEASTAYSLSDLMSKTFTWMSHRQFLTVAAKALLRSSDLMSWWILIRLESMTRLARALLSTR